MAKKLSRREFLRTAALGAAGIAAVACQPQTVQVVEEVTRVIKETVMVEGTPKVVEKVIKETVVVEGTPKVIEQVVTATPEPTATPVTGPVRGGTLIIAFRAEDPSLDAHDFTGWVGNHVRQALYDPLEDLNGETGEVIPGLATSWEYNDDFAQVTYYLREGVRFHDGTEFDAEALKWNYDRLRDPESTHITSGGGSFGKDWTNIEVLDKYTLRITTGPDQNGNPTAFAPAVSYGFYPVSPTSAEELGDAFGENPVGTGPYKFVKWERGTEIVLERNPDYWREDWPYVDGVIFRTIGDDQVRALALTRGDIDMAPMMGPREAVPLQDDPNLVVHQAVYGSHNLILNTKQPPLDKLANREAILYAIDYEAIRQLVYYGLSTRTNGITIPSASPWYQDSFPIVEQDLEKAKAKLEEAGNPDGFTFEVTTPPGDVQRQQLELIQSTLLDVGIEMKIQMNDRARHIEILRQDRNAANAAWVGQRIFPNWEQYQGQYHSQSATGFSQWQNEQADALIDESELLIPLGDKEKRDELCRQWCELVVRDWPAVCLAYSPMLVPHRKRVQNLPIHVEGLTEWRKVWLHPDLP